MNEPHDNDDFDKEISSLYRDASDEMPPAHMDDAILAAAKREVRARPRPLTPFSSHWMLPASLAAVIVLSVSVVTLVQKQPERTLTSEADSIAMPAQQEAKPLARAAAPEIAQTAGKKQILSEEKLARQEILTARPSKEEFRKSKPQPAPITESQPRPKLVINSPQDMTLANQGIAEPLPTTKSPPAFVDKPLAETTREAEVGETVAAADAEQEMAMASAAEPESSAQTAPLSMPRKAETEAPSAIGSGQFEQPLAQEKPAIAAFSAAPAQQTRLCANLTELQCLQTPRCVVELDNDKKAYICRKTMNNCELNFSQLNATQQNCESRSNCRFVPGSCYCPPNAKCVCGGGPPPACVER